MAAGLIPYSGDALQQAAGWATLAPEERRRRAVAACRDRDDGLGVAVSEALTVYSGDRFARTRQWVRMDLSERRRRAVQACRDRNAEALSELAEARMVLHGPSGSAVSEHTIRAYRVGIRVFLQDTGEHNLLTISHDACSFWLRQMEQGGKSTSTVTVRLAAARSLYAALRWAGATEADPFKDAKPARDTTPAHAKRQPYTRVMLAALLAVADRTETALVLLGSHAGLRVAEMTALRWSHVDLPAHRLTVFEGKGGKTATVALSTSLCAALAALPQSSEYILPWRTTDATRHTMHALCTRAGVPRLGVHALRHSCGTELQRQTKDLLTTSMHLRHSSTATTQVYVAWSDDSLQNELAGW